MGCVYSKVEREEAVRRCRERRRLMKQLVECRARFAAAHLAYLQSLRNTGATLRQFAEADSPGVLPAGDAASTTTTTTVGGRRRIRLPPPPPPLPPSPPPLPPFSPDCKLTGEEEEEEGARPALIRGGGGCVQDGVEEGDRPGENGGDESINLDSCDAEDVIHPPPSPHRGPAWDLWEPFDATSPSNSASPAPHKRDPPAVEDEDWAETKTEFDDEEEAGEDNAGVMGAGAGLDMMLREKLLLAGRGEPLGDDNSSAVSSWFTKDTDAAAVVWRSKKTLAGIVRELDDYFLKAAAGGTKVAAVLESNRAGSLHRFFEETKGKNLKSAKVFSSLSWRWSSRSPQSGVDAAQGTRGDDQSGSHCTTLDKIFAEEQKLYKEVKEEEMAKLRYRKKVLLLQKLEAREQDWTIIAKTRLSIEELQTEIMSLQESISNICTSISRLRDEELQPQLVELFSGLMQKWRTMYECHQVQNHIAQQVNHLHGLSNSEPTTESQRHATAQLETEVESWYNAFYNLLKAQRDYAHTLNQWVRLTDCLTTDGTLGGASGIYVLCEEWELALERLPEKVAAEAIKSFVSVVHAIGLQLAEEHSLQKKSEHMERKLEKELNSLSEMERDLSRTATDATISTPIFNEHPLSAKHAKMDAHRKRLDDEKSKYLNSVRLSRIMMINNLQTSLPNVFQALMGFANVCVQAFEGIYRPYEASAGHADTGSPSSEISQR